MNGITCLRPQQLQGVGFVIILCSTFYNLSINNKKKVSNYEGYSLRRSKSRVIQKIYFITSNIVSYPSPKNINMFWNFGFLVGVVMTINIVSGFLLGLHYIPNEASAFMSVVYIMRELYFGWLIRYVHSNGVSFGYIFIILHLFLKITVSFMWGL